MIADLTLVPTREPSVSWSQIRERPVNCILCRGFSLTLCFFTFVKGSANDESSSARRGFLATSDCRPVTSALSVADFCKPHELNQVTFYNWRRRLGQLPPRGVTTKRELACAALPRPTGTVAKARRSQPRTDFVELVVDSATESLRDNRVTLPARRQSLIEISLAGGMLVRDSWSCRSGCARQMVASIRDATCAQEGG